MRLCYSDLMNGNGLIGTVIGALVIIILVVLVLRLV